MGSENITCACFKRDKFEVVFLPSHHAFSFYNYINLHHRPTCKTVDLLLQYHKSYLFFNFCPIAKINLKYLSI